jgi:[lysine-biosynthesis-protein LysW]--L-2-aminoadipate ligase
MRIGLLYTVIRKEEKLIINELEKKGIEVVKIDDKSILIEPKKNIFPDMNVVMIRSASLSNALFWSRYFESIGILTINSYLALDTCGNKYLTSLRLIENEIKTPKIIIALSPESALQAMKQIGFPCVLKPVIGSWGRLVAKINGIDEAKSIIEHREHIQSAFNTAFYVQEYIEKPGRDIRTIVCGDKMIGAIYRKSDSWKTNTALGGIPEYCVASRELEELSIKAAKAVKGEIVSIDIFESGGKLLVNEVNGVTEFSRSIDAYKVNIAEKIASFAITKVKEVFLPIQKS